MQHQSRKNQFTNIFNTYFLFFFWKRLIHFLFIIIKLIIFIIIMVYKYIMNLENRTSNTIFYPINYNDQS